MPWKTASTMNIGKHLQPSQISDCQKWERHCECLVWECLCVCASWEPISLEISFLFCISSTVSADCFWESIWKWKEQKLPWVAPNTLFLSISSRWQGHGKLILTAHQRQRWWTAKAALAYWITVMIQKTGCECTFCPFFVMSLWSFLSWSGRPFGSKNTSQWTPWMLHWMRRSAPLLWATYMKQLRIVLSRWQEGWQRGFGVGCLCSQAKLVVLPTHAWQIQCRTLV